VTTVAGGLITLEFALEGLGYGAKQDAPEGELSVRDQDLATYIAAATPVIESLCGPVLQVTATQYGDGGKSAVLLSGRIANTAAVTAVRVNGSAWTGHIVSSTDSIVYAGTGVAFPAGTRNIEVDVTVGYSPVPDTLQLAARELVRHWLQVGKQSPAAGGLNIVPDSGDPTDPYAIPRRVRQLCAPYQQGGFA
jgi:hypothetical protein